MNDNSFHRGLSGGECEVERCYAGR
jgi:hypothetical protein